MYLAAFNRAIYGNNLKFVLAYSVKLFIFSNNKFSISDTVMSECEFF